MLNGFDHKSRKEGVTQKRCRTVWSAVIQIRQVMTDEADVGQTASVCIIVTLQVALHGTLHLDLDHGGGGARVHLALQEARDALVAAA